MSDGIPGTDLLRVSPQTYAQLAEFIQRELGIKMSESKTTMIQSRLQRRVRLLGLDSIDQYCRRLLSSNEAADERVHFINAITTNKTDFFREPDHFRYLTGTLLAQRERGRRGAPDRRILLWSAACSSGEEPYTLAMVLSEYAVGRPHFDFQILATDVSTKVLRTAREGIYTQQQVTTVPIELRRKYLLHGTGEQESLVRIKPEVRQCVSFHELNFMDADYRVSEVFDFIFCRNALIYFDRPTQAAVINKLCRYLVPGGHLFISLSESLSGLNVPLVHLGASCFRKRDP